MIQTKLQVGAVDDPQEHEADRVADRVMRMPEPNVVADGTGIPAVTSAASRRSQTSRLQRKCACGAGASIVTDECEECSKEEMRGVQRKLRMNGPGDAYEQDADRVAHQVSATPARSGVTGAPPRIQRLSGQSNRRMDAAPASVEQVLASAGRPLKPATRVFLETRFGRDFNYVRVHADSRADEAARAIDAHAYTAGHHVAFAAGRYAPQTAPGRSLLAHELTHVVQQNGAAPSTLIQRQPAFGGENLAARANISPEKWSEQIEQEYRKRDDFERANAVRACRLQGPPACKRLLTISEVQACYTRDIPPEDCPASEGDRPKVGAQVPGAAPVAAGAAVPLQYPSPAPAPPAAPAPRPTHVPSRHGPVRFPAPARPPVGVGVLAGPAAIGTVIVVSGIQLRQFGIYQEKLRALGKIILENPQKICIGGCHLPSRPQTPSLPDFGPSMLRPLPPSPFNPFSPSPFEPLPQLPPEFLEPRAGKQRLPQTASRPTLEIVPQPEQPEKKKPARRPCPAKVSLPSGRLKAEMANSDRGYTLQAPFSMSINFEHDPESGCDCGRGEYRQEIRGWAQADLGKGWKAYPMPLTATGQPIDAREFQEDADFGHPYGHRYQRPKRQRLLPQTLNDQFLPDRASGCHYRGQDRPGFDLENPPPGARYRFRLWFRGAPVDGVLVRVPLQDWQTWECYGEMAIPEPPKPTRRRSSPANKR